jgi:ABC-type transporter Mla subunit MlaD
MAASRRNRNPLGAISASPTMVGAVTTLIVIVAVFLAYNANNGLPFVPVYRVSVEVPDASRLTNNNEVRIGGHRVGVVESIDAVEAQDANTTAQAGGGSEGANTTGGAVARLNLKLDKAAGPLPKDSIFRVRYRSSFGLKYLEIIRGEGDPAPEGFTFDGTDDGGTCAVPVDPQTFTSEIDEHAKNGCFQQQTEFDEIADTFDTKTRSAVRENLSGYGSAFAGRGTSLNDAISHLEPLFRGLRPVTDVLIEPSTRFERFFPELGDAARIVAPVAEQQADFFSRAAVAFAAISSDPQALEDTISEAAPTLETGIDVLPRQRPFLRDLAVLGRTLRPGVQDLRATLPVLNDAIETGTPVLRDSPAMNRDLRAVLAQANRLVSNPSTRITLQRLRETFDTAEPLAKFVVPAQTVCNYWNYWFTFLPEALSDRDAVGYSFRQALTNFAPSPEVETPLAGYSGLQANGKDGVSGTFKPYELPILNSHAYGPAGQKNADCQGGQSGYELGASPIPGQGADNPAYVTPDMPGSRGPTTLFYNDQNERELQDTRVDSRQPETWKQVGR